jgi:hypothetical protein
MRKKQCLGWKGFSIGLVLLMLVLPLVSASPVTVGDWTVASDSEIGGSNVNSALATALYNYSISTDNTTLISYLAFDKFNVQTGFLPNVEMQTKYFYERIGIQTDAGTVWLSALEVKAWDDWYGAWCGRDVIQYMNDSGVGVHNSQSYSDQNFNLTLYAVANYTTDVVTVYSSVYSFEFASIGALELPSGGDYVFAQDFQLPSGCTPTNFLVYFGHSGNGDFHAYLTASVNGTSKPQGNNGVGNVSILPRWLVDFGNTISSALGFVAALIGMAIQLGAGLIPLLPIFFLAYLLDAVIASIAEGGVRPIGYFFKAILDMLYNVGEIIMRALQALAEVIPFPF